MNFPKLERDILDFWKREKCFETLVEKNRGKPPWSFLDGPITANNPMGVHHAWGRTYKDIFQRYKAMTGHELRYQNGFDCQGLWVEVEVEKELGFETKRDIETYGIDRFVEKCKERVLKYAAIQTAQSIRLGYWMDWDDSYFTMSDENNYTIWQFLKRCHQRGFLYHGHDAMPWCPRCGTGISQHEIHGEDRPEVVHESPTVRLPLRGREGEYLLVWTTTPWTLTSNVACAVHPELGYARVRQNGEIYYLAAERLEAVMEPKGGTEVLGELRGEALVDWTYDGPFDELTPQHGIEHRVIPWKQVSATEGTGIVHIAPGCGKEDYELGLAFDLPPIGPIDEAGVFGEEFGPFAGRFAGDVPEQVFDSLRDKGLLYRVESYKHNYPICWRCKSHLLFRLVDEWFIAMGQSDPPEGLRKEIIEVTRQTRWIPEVGQRLEIEWLLNMHDWMISKKRYWGLALPIYPCGECGSFDVIGSREELERRAVEGWDKFEGHSPHRPWIDEVRITCSTCDAKISRIPDVGNPWLDAGIVPYSTMRYNDDREYWDRWFPADWISESFPGQFRNWFYAILAMSTVMENRPPFKLMFGYKLMKDEHGEEMHKSKGNAVEFTEAAEREGADAMRWLFAAHNPDYDLRFGYNKIHEARREFLVLWNVYQFFVTYAPIDGFVPGRGAPEPAERPDLDRWILSRLETLVLAAEEHYEAYSLHRFMREVSVFFDALSRWYLRRSRRRIWKSDEDDDKLTAYQTLWECLTATAKLLAPVVPFATEHMYQELVRRYDSEAPVSVHHCTFPQAGRLKVDDDLLVAMDAVRGIVERGHAARSRARLKVRQPLNAVHIVAKEPKVVAAAKRFLPLILDELNVKRVEFGEKASAYRRLSARLNARRGKPKYKRDFVLLDESVARIESNELERLLALGEAIIELRHGSYKVPTTDLVITTEGTEHWAVEESDGVVVALDSRLTETLRQEGLVRDLVRQIQKLRKKNGLEVSDRVHLVLAADQDIAETIHAHRSYIANETLARDVECSARDLSGADVIRVGDHDVQITVAKAG